MVIFTCTTNDVCYALPGSKLTLTNSQNAPSDFDNLQMQKYPLANVCELESSMYVSKIWKEFASGLTSLLEWKKSYWQNFAGRLKS